MGVVRIEEVTVPYGILPLRFQLDSDVPWYHGTYVYVYVPWYAMGFYGTRVPWYQIMVPMVRVPVAPESACISSRF